MSVIITISCPVKGETKKEKQEGHLRLFLLKSFQKPVQT